MNERIVCMGRERARVFVPCMHFLLCEVCAAGVAKCPSVPAARLVARGARLERGVRKGGAVL